MLGAVPRVRGRAAALAAFDRRLAAAARWVDEAGRTSSARELRHAHTILVRFTRRVARTPALPAVRRKAITRAAGRVRFQLRMLATARLLARSVPPTPTVREVGRRTEL